MPYSYSNNPLYISEGQTVRFRYQAPSSWNTTETVVIRIGLLEQYWFITTIPEDFAPDPYSFNSINDAEPNTLYVYGDGTRPAEAPIIVSGLTPGTQASVSLSGNLLSDINNFAFRVKRNGESVYGAWFIPGGGGDAVENGDTFQIRLISSNLTARENFVYLYIGSAIEKWSITTRYRPLNAPTPFPDFDDLTNISPGSIVYSNILRIQGLSDPAIINVDSGALIGISSLNAFTTNAAGYNVLSGITFVNSSTNPTITNGQYLQLQLTTTNLEQVNAATAISIGERSNGSLWNVETGINLATLPDPFSFTDVNDALENALIGSESKPVLGITGLPAGVEVDVILLATTGTEPRIKINNGSIGLFPTKVKNGDTIILYNRSSATYSGNVTTSIKVGSRTIPTWTVLTNSGPDTNASFTPPQNLINRKQSTLVSSSLIAVNGINRPIEISATNGALISLNFDTAIAGPRTFNPDVHTVFQLYITTGAGLDQTVSTVVTVGTGTTNNPFTWTTKTYAVVPPPKSSLGRWYSKKTDKLDGYSIGTVIPIPKESIADYGDLSGDLDSRVPGFLPCDGSSYSVLLYPDLWWVIGNTYGGSGAYNTTTKQYSGTFNVPDYRNRKLTGMGVVDGTKGSSSFVPVSTPSKGIYDQGAEGGYWYVDKVDTSGPLPYEQIIGTVGASTGTTSPFFTFGTPKTDIGTVTAEVDFTVSGSVTALVGPLLDTLVNVPAHSHYYATAVTAGSTGDALIPWKVRGLMGMLGGQTPTTPGVGVLGLNAGPIGGIDGGWVDDSSNTAGPFQEAVVTSYLQAMTASGGSLFISEYAALVQADPSRTPLRNVIRAMINNITTASYAGGFGPDGSASDQEKTTFDINTWYLSAYDSFADSYLIDTGAVIYPGVDWNNPVNQYPAETTGTTGGTVGTVMIDTNSTTAKIESYTSPDGGSVVTHSHYITTTVVTDATTDYSYGNTAGGGTKNGLGGASGSLNITFDQSEVNNVLNTGTFTLNETIKKPTPTVIFSPNRQVPLLPAFHKVRYIIKAY